MRALYKRMNTSGHFPDFWHKAKSQRENKKIRAQMERQQLKREAEMEKMNVVRCKNCRYWEPENAEEGDTSGRCRNDYSPCQNQQTDMTWFCADGEEDV